MFVDNQLLLPFRIIIENRFSEHYLWVRPPEINKTIDCLQFTTNQNEMNHTPILGTFFFALLKAS